MLASITVTKKPHVRAEIGMGATGAGLPPGPIRARGNSGGRPFLRNGRASALQTPAVCSRLI